ncbi:hypothetical protein LLB_2224 [Legionella longbeachae D-4968]|nr:hypothetical protein LLB_2224 [Legionella longbeachae D-4968]
MPSARSGRGMLVLRFHDDADAFPQSCWSRVDSGSNKILIHN